MEPPGKQQVVGLPPDSEESIQYLKARVRELEARVDEQTARVTELETQLDKKNLQLKEKDCKDTSKPCAVAAITEFTALAIAHLKEGPKPWTVIQGQSFSDYERLMRSRFCDIYQTLYGRGDDNRPMRKFITTTKHSALAIKKLKGYVEVGDDLADGKQPKGQTTSTAVFYGCLAMIEFLSLRCVTANCSMETPLLYEKSRQIGLKAPPSLPPPRPQPPSDIMARPLSSTTLAEESFLDRKTPYNEFRSYQVDHWATQYEAMVRFRNTYNHCFVPHQYPENPALSSWVKRQRYQYKVMKAGSHSTLTPERRSKLEAIGFVWDSHKAIWEERYADLCRYQEEHGHTNVPVKFSDKSLAVWVKCQRRQHRLFRQGKPSSMTQERIIQLEGIGFDWKPRIGCPCKQPARNKL